MAARFTERGLGRFEIAYVRDKEKREVDFLLVKDNVPIALFEQRRAMRRTWRLGGASPRCWGCPSTELSAKGRNRRPFLAILSAFRRRVLHAGRLSDGHGRLHGDTQRLKIPPPGAFLALGVGFEQDSVSCCAQGEVEFVLTGRENGLLYMRQAVGRRRLVPRCNESAAPSGR